MRRGHVRLNLRPVGTAKDAPLERFDRLFRGAALPAPRQFGHRLRDLHARPARSDSDLESWSRALQGLPRRRNHRRAFLAILQRRGSRGRFAGASAADCSSRRAVRSEGWRIRKDGSRFWAHAVLDQIRAPDGTLLGFAKITRDITDSGNRKRPLRKRAAFSNAGRRGPRLRDLHARPRWPNHHWNSGAELIKGYSVKEIVGQHFSASTPKRIARVGSRSERWPRRSAKGSMSARHGGFVRMDHCSGPMC